MQHWRQSDSRPCEERYFQILEENNRWVELLRFGRGRGKTDAHSTEIIAKGSECTFSAYCSGGRDTRCTQCRSASLQAQHDKGYLSHCCLPSLFSNSSLPDSLLDGADNVKESSRSGSNSRSDILKHRRRARFQIKGSAQTDLATSEQQSTVLTQAKPPSASRPAVARLRNRDRTRGRVSHTSDTREEQLEEQHAAVKTVPDQITRIETGMPNPDEDVSEAQESVSSIPRVEAQVTPCDSCVWRILSYRNRMRLIKMALKLTTFSKWRISHK